MLILSCSHRKSLRCASASLLSSLVIVCLAPWNPAAAHKFKILHSFCAQSGCTDGGSPGGTLYMDASGSLYGISAGGGTTGHGTVYELVAKPDRSSWKFKVLHNFCEKPNCADGDNPSDGQLIADTSGNLYGVTSTGGLGGSDAGGTVFELIHNADGTKWSIKLLYQFCSLTACADGELPRGLTYLGASGGASYDGNSPLFGTTGTGGIQNQGTMFEVEPAQGQKEWSETVIYNFCSQGGDCLDGADPQASPIMNSAGNLYGTTYNGGNEKKGALFELTAGPSNRSWAETVLYSFRFHDGRRPDDGQLFINAAGNLFGMTEIGGRRCPIDLEVKGCGVAYQLIPAGTDSQLTALHRFCGKTNCPDGAIPRGGLIMDISGNLYGTANYGGGNDIDEVGLGGGTTFKLDGSVHVLHAFCAEANCVDGEYPLGSVIMDSAGNLFGTTSAGGANNTAFGGTVFEVTP